MVLASFVPWLRDALVDQARDFYSGGDTSTRIAAEDACLVIPTLDINDFVTFVGYLLEDIGPLQPTDVEQLEFALANVGEIFKLDALYSPAVPTAAEECVVTLPDASPHVEVEEVVIGEQDEEEEVEKCPLSEVDIMALNSNYVRENFTDQDDRLVCLMCYQIFMHVTDAREFLNHLNSHPRSHKKRVLIPKPPDLEEPEVRSYKCDVCGKAFTKATVLNGHKFRKHGIQVETDKFACSLCQFRCANLPGLKAHQRSHERKTLSCRICHRKFGNKRILEIHTRAGSCQLERRTCAICSKVYSDPAKLKMHMKVHTGEKVSFC